MVGAVANVPFADVKIVKMNFRFMSKMDIIVQWATILSPIIAVLIAWLTVRSSAKDTAKKISTLEKSTKEQIVALEESTKKEVESVKELTNIQIELSILQTEIQLKEMDDYHKVLSQRVEEESKNDNYFNQYDNHLNAIRQEEKRIRDLMDEQLKTTKQFRNLHELRFKLIELKKRIGGK